jgi:hypothetical protein
MTIRPAERRLPNAFLPLSDGNRRAVRAFVYGSVLFGGLGFVAGFLVGWAA